MKKFKSQKPLKYAELLDKRIYLAYINEKLCITADVIGSKRASDARTRRDFPCDVLPIGQMLSQLSPTTYIAEEDVLDIFNPDVISTSTVKQGFDQVADQLDTIIYGSLGAFFDGSSTATVGNNIAEQLHTFKQQLQTKCVELSTVCSRKINNELPISGWLHAHLASKLDTLGFIVDTQSKLTKPVGPLNEYVYSQPDLLLYHSERFLKHVSALTVKVTYPCIDVLSAEESVLVYDEVHVMGIASEVKVEDAGEDAVNECYCNMFGQGVNLAMKGVCKGMLVKQVTMYGIVVAAHKSNEARLLKLLMNFEENSCTFQYASNHYNFTTLLNSVIAAL